MKSAVCTLFFYLITVTAAVAGHKSITFFSNGALVDIEAGTSNDIVEINLPAGMIENSLRIRPAGNAVIKQVDMIPARADAKRVKEIDSLTEQKNRLEDRIKALETREEIFRAAAKSQSGKAPRKSKSNPDPIQSIRQGTEYAIAQLESVYTAKRRTEQEIRRIDAKQAMLKKEGTIAEAVARVLVTPKNARVTATYALAGFAWTPVYDLRLNNEANARLTLSGQLPTSFRGYRLKAAPTTLAEGSTSPVRVANGGSTVRLAEYLLPVKNETFGAGPATVFSCILTNQSPVYLPPGEASIYHKGEFRGKVRFDGISSGRSRKVSLGTGD